jgi:hypothetical protein
MDAIDRAIAVLNRALAADPVAIKNLIDYRVPCNRSLGSDPAIQTSWDEREPKIHRVGILGIVNGLFGIDEKTWGPIAAEVADDGTITKFLRRPGTFAHPGEGA